MPRPWSSLLILLTACGGGKPEWAPLSPPARYEQDLGQAEEAAFAVERDLRSGVLDPLRAGDREALAGAFTEDALVRLAGEGAWTATDEGPFLLQRYQPAEAVDGAAAAADRLLALVADWTGLARAEVSLDRFWLDGAQATGRFDLRLAGETTDGGRGDLRLTCRATFAQVNGAWLIARLEATDGTRLDGPPPRFVEVTAETGLHYGVSGENLAMLTEFSDLQQTLALGGLSVVDWNRDGFWDLLGTRRGQLATLFQNDGAGGFVPRPLPMATPRQCGSFLLLVDLDGDGRRELVGSEPLGFAGDQAWCGIWRETDEGWDLDERALTFPNPVGLRRLSVQTVVPCDVQGDGRLDLFFAVYGSALSRGKDYNTVEAHDGADNHLFIQQADGTFVEESEARGLFGTQYTYVAQAFDFDGDGDVDLFEGNDFGPNVLWRNDGDGQFLADDELGFDGGPAYTMGVTMADLDGSGRWSLYLSNMSSAPGQRIVPVVRGLDDGMRSVVATIASGNQLYTQDPDSGRWQEHAADLGVDEAGWAWGCVFWDPDGDGDPDLFVTNGFTSHSDRAMPDWQSWYWRQVVADAGSLQRGARSRDVNVDHYRPSSFNGYERDKLFHRAADGTFHEAAWLYGLDADHDGRCAVPVDMDGDGDLDLALWTLQGLRLFENRGAPQRFLRLALRATTGHPAALGAVATVTADGRTQRAAVRLTEGFQSQVPDVLHFGLGPGDDRTARVEVAWPSGTVQVWDAVPVGCRATLTEGEAIVRCNSLPVWLEAARPRPAAAPGLDHLLEGAAGEGATLGAPGRVTVVRLQEDGSTWRAARALAEAHPDVAWQLVLTTDAPPPADSSNALRASAALLEAYFPGAPPTLPATFVFDRDGVPRRSFRREVSEVELGAVLDTLADEPAFPELLVMSGRLALEEGRLRLAQEYFQRALDLDDRRADACEGLGRIQMIQERPDLAEPAYARAVDLDPDYALGQYNLGVARVRLDRPAEAIAPLRESLRITGDRATALMTLAEAGYLAQQPEVALDAWRRAAVVDPGDPEPLLNRAKLLGQLARLPEARAAFEAVLALRPEHAEARMGLERVEALLERDG